MISRQGVALPEAPATGIKTQAFLTYPYKTKLWNCKSCDFQLTLPKYVPQSISIHLDSLKQK